MKVWELQQFNDSVNTQLTELSEKLKILKEKALTIDATQQQTTNLSVTTPPSSPNNVVRLEEIKFQRVLNHTSQLSNPNTVWEWTIPQLQARKLHTFIVKVGVPNTDFTFSWSAWIENLNYKNMGPIHSFNSDNTGIDGDIKIKVWIDNNKFKMVANRALAIAQVYLLKETVL